MPGNNNESKEIETYRRRILFILLSFVFEKTGSIGIFYSLFSAVVYLGNLTVRWVNTESLRNRSVHKFLQEDELHTE